MEPTEGAGANCHPVGPTLPQQTDSKLLTARKREVWEGNTVEGPEPALQSDSERPRPDTVAAQAHRTCQSYRHVPLA